MATPSSCVQCRVFVPQNVVSTAAVVSTSLRTDRDFWSVLASVRDFLGNAAHSQIMALPINVARSIHFGGRERIPKDTIEFNRGYLDAVERKADRSTYPGTEPHYDAGRQHGFKDQPMSEDEIIERVAPNSAEAIEAVRAAIVLARLGGDWNV